MMLTAVRLARRGFGFLKGRRPLGVVVAKNDRIVFRTWTTRDRCALEHALDSSKSRIPLNECTVFVAGVPEMSTLARLAERAPACLILPSFLDAAQFPGEVVERFRSHGIALQFEDLADDAKDLQLPSGTRASRPQVLLKLATSLDGRIASRTGHSRWITGPVSRRIAHRLRADADAILVGVDTALTDNPALTCRLPGLNAASPIRVVLDSRLRLALESEVVKTAKALGTWVVALADADSERGAALARCGVELLLTPVADNAQLDLPAVLELLKNRGIRRLLVEGGSRVAASFIRAGLVDRIYWFHAPMLVGGDGIASLSDLGLDRVSEAQRWRRVSARQMGQDLLQVFDATG